MIDLHLHLLPGVDDGPPDLAAALDLARECAATDTPLVVATPHVDDWTRGVLPDAATVRARVAQLREEIDRASISLRVVPGGEAFLAPELSRQVREGRVPTIGETHWLLVETPVGQRPLYLDQVFFELLAEGITPLLAHAERYGWLTPDALATLVSHGVRVQVTASALTGQRGRRQRALAETLVRRGLAQVISTDRHKAASGATLPQGYEAAAALVGEARARALVETNPGRILADQEIPVEIDDERERASARPRGWLDRLRGR